VDWDSAGFGTSCGVVEAPLLDWLGLLLELGLIFSHARNLSVGSSLEPFGEGGTPAAAKVEYRWAPDVVLGFVLVGACDRFGGGG
jgi:hypothetical protein